MPTEKPRYTVIVDEALLKEIDDFRFENRFPSRSAATLELIRLGMESIKKKQADAKKAPPTPRDRPFSSFRPTALSPLCARQGFFFPPPPRASAFRAPSLTKRPSSR